MPCQKKFKSKEAKRKYEAYKHMHVKKKKWLNAKEEVKEKEEG